MSVLIQGMQLRMPDGAILCSDWGYVIEGMEEIINYFKEKEKNDVK